MNLMSKSLSSWLSQRSRNQPLPTLGVRELEVMKTLWRQGELSAQKMLTHSREEALSLSTMQSTLERLHRKGLLERRKSGRQYFYKAAISQSDLISRMLQDMTALISDGDMAPMLSGIMDFVGEQNANLVVEQADEMLEPKDNQES